MLRVFSFRTGESIRAYIENNGILQRDIEENSNGSCTEIRTSSS